MKASQKSGPSKEASTVVKRVPKTFSMDARVLEKIELVAEKENRTPSNALETLLKRHFKLN
ncbi:MAG TPA: hypothetical protein PLB89_18055 [Flavobacteriales bacterium]|nr:hypothetical protein [Flavobacteriales bacterium]